MGKLWVQNAALLLFAVGACGRSTRSVPGGESGGVGGTSGTAIGAGKGSRGGGAGNPSAAGRGGPATTGGSSGLIDRGGRGGSSGQTAPGGIGGTSEGDCTTDPQELDGLSFNVTFAGPGQGVSALSAVLHFDEEDSSSVSVVFGSPGQAYREEPTVRETSDYGRTWSFDGPLTLLVKGNNVPQTTVSLNQLDLCVHGGAQPSLVGSGNLTFDVEHDDYTEGWDSDFTLSAVPDTVPPSWVAPPAALDPLAFAVLPMAEPLTEDASAWLAPDVADAAAPSLLPVKRVGTVVGFKIEQVLPLGLTSYTYGTATDLGGLALPELLESAEGKSPLATYADPGVQPLDGFESVLKLATVFKRTLDGNDDEPTLVNGADALEGSQSLRIPAGLKVLLHLERPSDATRLSFDLRPVDVSLDYSTSIVIRAGIVGSTHVATREVKLLLADLQSEGEAGAGGAGPDAFPVERVELELLPPTTAALWTEDVIVTIETPWIETTDFVAAGAIVDRITLD